MSFQDPIAIYTSASNLEAHLIVEMLEANGIASMAVEDQSGVSLWIGGAITQFHKPKVWVERSAAETAAKLIAGFEENRRRRGHADTDGDVSVRCDECGETATFPGSLNGTIQECPHCHALVDVGDIGFDEDFGEPDAPEE